MTYFSFLNLELVAKTCLKDVKRMEPIDGLSKINKVFTPSSLDFGDSFWSIFVETFSVLSYLQDRWKLLCSICTVAYGACIQVLQELFKLML